MDNKQLCQWLRDNSSGVYRPAAVAAERIENLLIELKRMQDVLAKTEERKKWWMKNAEGIAEERGELFRAGEALAKDAFESGLISKVEAWDEAAQPMRDMIALLKSALPN
jgi:hypothetical protein